MDLIKDLDNITNKYVNYIRYWFDRGQYSFDMHEKWFGRENLNLFNGDIENKYKNLIRGLDSKSIDIIDRIIFRIQEYFRTGSPYFTMSDEERTEFLDLHKHLYSKILKLSENVYYWNGYNLPVNAFEPNVFYHKYYLPEISNKKQIKNKNIIDVGGYVGDSALVFSKFTNKKVYTFEPTSFLYDSILKTIQLNKLQNVVPVKKGLGSNISKKDIYIASFGGSTFVDRKCYENNQKETVEITTLDDFVENNNIKVGLIKVDIEGAEQEFLKGAINTIKKQKPVLLISIYHNFDDFFNIKPLIESWDLGYKFKIMKPINGQVYTETILLAERDRKWTIRI